jgi:glycosyltransferase involved in cell wall biosynthesis
LKNKQPKLSIIIPVLNNLAGLKKTIDSVNNQIFRDFEVWIIDGQSTIETQEYLKTLASPFFHHIARDTGIYDAMNSGIFLANGEWCYFLGTGDVFFRPNTLQLVFENKCIKQANLFSGSIRYQGHTRPFVYSKNKRIKNPSWSFLIWIRNGLHHQGTFYRKALFSKYTYALKYRTLADYWFNLQLYKQNETCNIIPNMIAICNSDGVSKLGSWDLYREEISLKLELSSNLLLPFFYILAFMKYVLKKIFEHA